MKTVMRASQKMASIVGVITMLYILTTLLALFRVEGWFSDILSGTLFYLIPWGVGLLLLAPPSIRRSAQMAAAIPLVILFALFVGLEFDSLVFVCLEKWWPHPGMIDWAYPILALCSLGGWRLWSQEIAGESFFKRSGLAMWRMLPTALLFYFTFNIWTSPYPLRNLFQDVHFLKGASEFARFEVLNPFIGDTYIPFIQTHMGFLERFYHVDLLRLQWILPIDSLIVHSLAILVVIAALEPAVPFVYEIVLGLNIVIRKNIFSFNNGDLLLCLTAILLAVLFRWHKRQPAGTRVRAAIMPYLTSIAVLIGLWGLRLEFWQLAPFLVVTLTVFAALASYKQKSFYSLFSGVLIAVAFGFHRMILSYSLVVLSLGLIYALVLSVAQRNPERLRAWYVRITIAGSVVVVLTAWVFRIHPDVAYKSSGWLLAHGPLKLADLVLHKKIDPNDLVQTGGGIFHAYIEWVRAATPLIHLFVLGLALLLAIVVMRRRREPMAYPEALSIASVLMFFAALALTVNTFPYWYRNLPFAVLMASITVAVLMETLWADFSRSVKRALLAVPFCLLIYVGLIWQRSWIGFHNPEHPFFVYLTEFLPLCIGVTVISVILILGYYLALRNRQSPSAQFLSASILIWSLSVEQTFTIAKFYTSSIGDTSRRTHVIAHYSREDVAAARSIHGLSNQSILISDFPTMAIFKALTGVSGISSFSNIDVVAAEYVTPIAQIIGDAVAGNPALAKNDLAAFIRKFPGACPEAEYVYRSRYKIDFDFKNVAPHLVFVVSRRTLGWKNCILQTHGNCANFFPVEGGLDPRLVETITSKYKILENLQNQILVFQFKDLKEGEAP